MIQERIDTHKHTTEIRKMATFTTEIPVIDKEGKTTPKEPALVSIRDGQGLRVIFGAIDDSEAPDILIERAPTGWRVIFHLAGESGDPAGGIMIRDAEPGDPADWFFIAEQGATEPYPVENEEAIW